MVKEKEKIKEEEKEGEKEEVKEEKKEVEEEKVKKVEKRGKKKRKNRKPSEKWKIYSIEESKVKRKNKFCPKCGEGVFLAEHKDRFSCGKCGYTIFK
jgi:small subunit ribosomal protein S27Ae